MRHEMGKGRCDMGNEWHDIGKGVRHDTGKGGFRMGKGWFDMGKGVRHDMVKGRFGMGKGRLDVVRYLEGTWFMSFSRAFL